MFVRSDTLRTMATSLVALVCGSAVCQAPSAWQTTVLPQPVVTQSLKGQGKLVTYDLGTSLRVYSAVTRRWHSTSKSPNATVRVFNDCVVILDTFSCKALASHADQFRAIALTSAASLLNSGSSKNDSIVLVHEPQQLHAFSAFTGQWRTRPVTANLGVAVRRHVAVFADGSTLGGMSAFEGLWHVHSATTSTSLDADGSCGFAFAGNQVHAFSAHQRNWQSTTLPLATTFVRGDDWSLWTHANGALGYSGLRGAFATTPTTTTSVAGQTDLYALLTTTSGLLAYSAFTGDFLSIDRQPTAIDFGDAIALLHDLGGVRGYTPLHQQVRTLHHPATATDVGTVVGVATDAAGVSHVFDGQLPAWVHGPAGTSGSVPTVTTTTVALRTTTDCYAYAVNRGQFVRLGTPVQALAANTSSSPLIGYDASKLYAFDTRAARWLETPRPGSQPPVINIWRTSALIHGGGESIGIGAQAGTWQRHQVGAPLSQTTNSEVGYVVENDRIHACGMVPRLLPFQQFPQFRRVQPTGSELLLRAALPTGAIGVIAIGQITTPLSLPGLGTLQIDGATAALATVVPSANDPMPRVSLGPAATVLRGYRVGCQMVVVDGGGAIYLDDLAAFEIW